MYTQYSCGKCGHTLDGTYGKCPYCGANLSGIKCSKCGYYSASTSLFKNGLCPSCQNKAKSSSDGSPDIGSVWGGVFVTGVAAVVLGILAFGSHKISPTWFWFDLGFFGFLLLGGIVMSKVK